MSATELFTTVDTLSGPANADNFRMTVDWGRWYIDPLPTCEIAEATEAKWPSISAVKKAADKDWSFLVIPRMAAIDGDELHRIARLDRTQRVDALNSHEKFAKQIAFGRGSIVHLWKEDLLAGRAPRQITDAWLAANKYPAAARDDALRYLPAIVDFFDTYQPEPVAVEYVTIHRTLNGHGYGGTPDALLKIEGEIVAADWKTRNDGSNHGAFPEELAQVSAGAGAEYMIVRDGDHAVRRPIPRAQGGVIVSIKTDGARLYPLDLDKGWEHWCHLHEWWTHRLNEKAGIGRVKPKRSGPPVTQIAAPISPEPAPTGEGLTLFPSPVDEPLVGEDVIVPPDLLVAVTDELRRAELRRRYNLLNDHDRAKFRGLMLDPDDLDLIETHLDGLDAFMNVHAEPAPPKPPKASYKEGDKVTYKGKEYVVGTDNGSSVYLPDLPDRLSTRSQHTKAGQWGYPPLYERWVPKRDVTPVAVPKVVSIPEPSLGHDVEGDLVDDAEWTATARAFDALDATAKTWIKNIVAEAHEAQQWMSGAGGNRTTRRHQLLCGLVCLASGGHDEDGFVRLVVSTVLGFDNSMRDGWTLGCLVGSLNVTHATKFAELCQAFCAGELQASVTPDGTMRLIPAA